MLSADVEHASPENLSQCSFDHQPFLATRHRSMSINLTANFLSNSRGITLLDGGGITWSINKNTNAITGTVSGGGAVTSVGVADTSGTPIYTITNSPVTSSGTINLALKTQNANLIFAGPTTGAAAQPTFRAMVPADLPTFAPLQNFNITPDTHPTPPTGVGVGPNDEFEVGSIVDTAGTRYAGATAWTAFGLSTGSAVVTNGAAVFLPALIATRNFGGWSQPVAGATFTYQAKIKVQSVISATGSGIFFATASGAAGKIMWVGFGNNTFIMQKLTNNTTFSVNASTAGAWTTAINLNATATAVSPWIYFQLTYDGTNIKSAISDTGYPGTFAIYFSETAATFLGGAPTLVGFGADNESVTTQQIMQVDWFRRTA